LALMSRRTQRRRIALSSPKLFKPSFGSVMLPLPCTQSPPGADGSGFSRVPKVVHRSDILRICSYGARVKPAILPQSDWPTIIPGTAAPERDKAGFLLKRNRQSDEAVFLDREVGLKRWSALITATKQRGAVMLAFILSLIYQHFCKKYLAAAQTYQRWKWACCCSARAPPKVGVQPACWERMCLTV